MLTKICLVALLGLKVILNLQVAKPSCLYLKNCTNLIREIKSYWWAENDRPQKKDDHALDELRYFIMSKPQTYKMQVVKSPIQKDKERLIKKLKNNAKRL